MAGPPRWAALRFTPGLSLWKKQKNLPCSAREIFSHIPLHSAGDLTGTEASGADVHMLGSTVHDRLDPLHIGLPGTVGAAVRVGDLIAEHNALVAEFTFGHSLLPPRWSGYA